MLNTYMGEALELIETARPEAFRETCCSGAHLVGGMVGCWM